MFFACRTVDAIGDMQCLQARTSRADEGCTVAVVQREMTGIETDSET